MSCQCLILSTTASISHPLESVPRRSRGADGRCAAVQRSRLEPARRFPSVRLELPVPVRDAARSGTGHRRHDQPDQLPHFRLCRRSTSCLPAACSISSRRQGSKRDYAQLSRAQSETIWTPKSRRPVEVGRQCRFLRAKDCGRVDLSRGRRPRSTSTSSPERRSIPPKPSERLTSEPACNGRSVRSPATTPTFAARDQPVFLGFRFAGLRTPTP